NTYKSTIEPELRLKLVQELQEAGVEPDVWSFGHFNNPEEYQRLVKLIKRDGRDNVGIIISDYDANSQQIASAIKKNANVNGVIGYAAGSAVFWDAMLDYHKGIATRQQARNRIAQEIMHLYQQYKSIKSDVEPTKVQEEISSEPVGREIEERSKPEMHIEVEQPQLDKSQDSEDVEPKRSHWIDEDDSDDQVEGEGYGDEVNQSDQDPPKKGIFSKLFKR